MDRATEITRDILNALTQIRRLPENSSVEPEVLHGRFRAFVDRMMRRASELGFGQQDIQDMSYALVALIDETVLTSVSGTREFWLPRLLQLQYFNENIAGDNFFVRLGAVRSEPSRVDVLKVYYLCLLFGFQGKYRVRGGEIELQNQTEAIQADLMRAGHIQDVPLAPSAERPRENVGGRRAAWPLILLSIGAVVFAVLLYVGLKVAIGFQAQDVVDRLDELSSEQRTEEEAG